MRNINIFKVANLLTVVVSLAFIVLPLAADAQFRTVTSTSDPVGNVDNATQIIIRVIEILLAIVGLVAVIFLVVGGFRYITSAGNEEVSEGAKKTITNAIIGIVIVILAFVIVRVISNALINKNV